MEGDPAAADPADSYPMDMGDEDDEIHQEDTWEVVSAYFEDKGLVRQQLDSFNEFIGTTIQEVPPPAARRQG